MSACVVAEHDPFEDRAAFSRETGRDRRGEPAAQAVGEAADASAPADLLPLVDVQDDVHAVAAQPGALVEPVLGPARRPDDGEHLEDRALRRRAAERELELNALVERRRLRTGGRGPGRGCRSGAASAAP